MDEFDIFHERDIFDDDEQMYDEDEDDEIPELEPSDTYLEKSMDCGMIFSWTRIIPEDEV